jgi:hypothetical protein
MPEKRKHPRTKAPFRVTVYDRSTDTAIGQVVNISIGGLMLISDRPIPADQVFQLRISLPEPIAEADSVEFGAESLWKSPAMVDDYFWTGFQIIDISESDSRILEALIQAWGS